MHVGWSNRPQCYWCVGCRIPFIRIRQLLPRIPQKPVIIIPSAPVASHVPIETYQLTSTLSRSQCARQKESMPLTPYTSHFCLLRSLFTLVSHASEFSKRLCTFGSRLRLVSYVCILGVAQPSLMAQSQTDNDQVQRLQKLVMNLESRVAVLEQQNQQ